MRLLNNVERAEQMTSTPLQHFEHSREQKKCWTDVEAIDLTSFQLVSTRFNTFQHGGKGVANAFNIAIQQNRKDVEAVC